MATLRLWMATAWHFDLVMAGVGLHLLATAAVGLGERAFSWAEPRLGSLGGYVAIKWARFWVRRSLRWARASGRRLKRAQELAEREGLFR